MVFHVSTLRCSGGLWTGVRNVKSLSSLCQWLHDARRQGAAQSLPERRIRGGGGRSSAGCGKPRTTRV
eukprot:15975446-Heterocapsa_arctica.AAC.1